jgi:peptidyl-prolyl cis-trans isomerase SurA
LENPTAKRGPKIPTRWCRTIMPIIMGCALALGTIPEAVSPVRAQTSTEWANDASITEDEIEQRSKLILSGTHKPPTRQDVINTITDDRKVIAEAEKLGVSPTDDEVDEAFATMGSRMRVTTEQLTKALANFGTSADTLKQRIKADMARSRLQR